MSPAWPKRWTPRQVIGDPEEAQRVRVAVEQADDRDALAEQLLERARVAVAEAGAGLEGAEQQVGAGDADDLDVDPGVLRERVGGLERLGDERAHHGDAERGRVVRPQLVAARDRLLARAGVVRLVDRARREAEVGARPAGLAELGERVQEAPLEVLAEGGLVGDAAGLLDADAAA